MPIRFRGEIKVPVAGHDDVHLVLHGGDGEFVGRIEGGLRGGKRPGTDAGVLLGDDGSGGSEADEDQRTNCGGNIDGINVADSQSLVCALRNNN
jgi:hypothetical protein